MTSNSFFNAFPDLAVTFPGPVKIVQNHFNFIVREHVLILSFSYPFSSIGDRCRQDSQESVGSDGTVFSAVMIKRIELCTRRMVFILKILLTVQYLYYEVNMKKSVGANTIL